MKMRVEMVPVHKGVHNVHTPFWPDKHAMNALCLARGRQLSEEDHPRELGFVMSSPRPKCMNE